MELKIQTLENVLNEVRKSVTEKDDRINKLQAQIQTKTETSELTQLQTRLNETEKCLRTVLTENQSLQVWEVLFSFSSDLRERKHAWEQL